MDPRSKKLYDANESFILKEASQYFKTIPAELKKLDCFESVVFDFQVDNKNYIMKITHEIHRSYNAICSELDWVDHLVNNNIPVAVPIKSLNNNFVEKIQVDDSEFFVYAFEKIEGSHADLNEFDKNLVFKWGEITGKMHAATKNYVPKVIIQKRHSWADEILKDADKYLPDDQKKIIDKAGEFLKEMKTFPQSKDSYGLIHTDLHHGNFFVKSDGNIVMFDTDDSHYCWFVYDIAIPFYYTHRDKRVGEKNYEYLRKYYNSFMDGYNSKNSLDNSWFEKIEFFLRLRDIELYLILYMEKDLLQNEWCARFMDGRKEIIESGQPVIDFDFSKF